MTIFDGYDCPSCKDMRRGVSMFGGSILTAVVYWLGSKAVLSYSAILELVEHTGIGVLSVSCEGPLLVIKGVKELQSERDRTVTYIRWESGNRR